MSAQGSDPKSEPIFRDDSQLQAEPTSALELDQVFASLRRADQRRWARIYVAGLLLGEGRKSIPRMGRSQLSGRSDQSLQQFVNQSQWDAVPVRQALAARLGRANQPAAWVVGEVAFKKYGRHSAGVERQYARSLGRVSNCQLGLTVSLVGAGRALPVNWRLMLPPSWDHDTERRQKAYIPAHERYLPYWRHAVSAVSDISDGWAVTEAPVITEASQPGEAVSLIAALEELGYGYAVEVSRHFLAQLVPGRGEHPASSALNLTSRRPSFVADLFRDVLDTRRQTLPWSSSSGYGSRSQFLAVQARPFAREPGQRTAAARSGGLLLAEWPVARPEPRRFWMTNLGNRSVAELVALVQLGDVAHQALDVMQQRFGLCDFEGRSFQGWHHHVTLASAAYAQHLLTAPSAPPL